MKDFKQIKQNEIFYRVVNKFTQKEIVFMEEIIFIGFNSLLIDDKEVIYGWFYKINNIESAFCLDESQFEKECHFTYLDALYHVKNELKRINKDLNCLIKLAKKGEFIKYSGLKGEK